MAQVENKINDFTSPAVLAMNIIRYIGDQVSKSGSPIFQFTDIAHTCGGSNAAFMEQLFTELAEERNLIRVGRIQKGNIGCSNFYDVNLTLEGWEEYERQKHGSFSGNQGFLAMQYNDLALEEFVQEVVKPAVEHIGYGLVDMRDVARAGVIDNIMRVQIRDSAFVIADLTHANPGAYWEAGYAEGLGKPVIYICEKAKFEKDSTHFDTNHCTTIPWTKGDSAGFREKLIATLRRSLELDTEASTDDA